jgi:hypothetical protein
MIGFAAKKAAACNSARVSSSTQQTPSNLSQSQARPPFNSRRAATPPP